MRNRSRSFVHLRLRGLLVAVFIVGSLIAVGPAESVLAATFAVNSNGDGHDAAPWNGVCETASGNGTCTLRAAIEAANALGGASTITIPAMTITLALSTALDTEPQITANITINGAGSSATIIQPTATFFAANTRVLTVASNGTATLSGVTIQNGKVTPPTISGGCGHANGGGIANSGTLTVNNSIITANVVAAGCSGGGGGIYNIGMLTLNNTNITDNSDNAGSPDGGALCNDTGGIAILNGGVFSSNHSSLGGGGIGNLGNLTAVSTFIGGNSVDQGGGAGILSNGPLTLTSLFISGNTATKGNGGGLSLIFGSATLTNVTVIANTTNYGAGGGGIFISDPAQMTINNSTIGKPGGGNGNTASGGGGGILNDGTLTLQNATSVFNNTANGAAATSGGGGIYNYHNGATAGSGVLIVDASSIGQSGLGNTAHLGGGIYNHGGTVMVRNGSSVSANVGLFGGGGILNENNDAATVRGGTVTVDNSVIGGTASGTGNTATPGNSANGGGIFSLLSAQTNTVTLQNNARVQSNLANGGNGGGIYSGGFLNVTASTVSTNSALFGAGIESFTEMTMATSTVRDNTGLCGNGYCGGGILAKSDASIAQSTISGNGSGGIFVGTGGGVAVTNSTISGNGGAGGGVSIGCSPSCSTTLTNVTIANNSFGIIGVSGTSGTVNIKNSILSNIGANCSGSETITSGDYNISNGTCPALAAAHDRNNLNPGIGPLANNGGPTQTHALLGESPAFNAIPVSGNGNGSPPVDQRGVARPQGPGYDIGAFEAQPNPVPSPRPGPSAPGVPRPVPLQRPGPSVPGIPAPIPLGHR